VKLRLLSLLVLLACLPVELDSALMPNRGTQLFVLISGRDSGTHIIAMTPSKRDILGEWNCDSPTYDFVFAVVESAHDGSKVRFTRHVMKDDYTPRTENLELFFPYAKQASYSFFDIGSIMGFYRNSASDFDLHEIFPSMPHT
jgi:hypothetical protein